MSQNVNPVANSKRFLDVSDTEQTDLQIPKRIADSNTMPKHTDSQTPLFQPPINQLFAPIGRTTPDINTNQIVSNDGLNQQQPSLTNLSHLSNLQESNNSTSNIYTLPTKNSFALLANANANKNSAHDKQKVQPVQNNVKIPPITVVGAMNFTKALQILNNAPNAHYSIKYMSIGTKILVDDIKTYENLKKSLNESNVNFFSHDLISEKFDKFVLSGIAKVPIEDIDDSLKLYQLEAVEIREIPQKTKRFDNEGMYVVSFKHGSVKLANLNKTKINYTIPKWRLFQSPKNAITQCRRCQLHGHGMRNCNMSPKCVNCGLEHLSDSCNSPIVKCANCKGEHQAVSIDCPKRKEFIEMRNRLASSTNKTNKKPTPAPRKNIVNFPNMPNSSTNVNKAADGAIADTTDFNSWSNLFKKNRQTPPKPANNDPSNLFKPEEIGPIMVDLLTGLKACSNKEQQLIVMFEIATKYIYNASP